MLSYYLDKQDASWERHNLVYSPTEENKRRCYDSSSVDNPVKFDPDKFFSLVAKYDAQNCMLAASSNGKNDTKEGNETGIVSSHAYTILSAYQSKINPKIKLLRLRNPWGNFEWKGAWSDDSDKWKQHAVVATEIKLLVGGVGVKEDDGSFWMHFDDFARHFDKVTVCLTHLGMGNLKIEVNENCGRMGPAFGCLTGFCSFTLGCQGLRKLYCTRSGVLHDAYDIESQIKK